MKISKFGLILATIYLVITVGIFLYAFTCASDSFCSFWAFVPVLPWPIVLEFFSSSPIKALDSTFGLFLFASLNLSIIYLAGFYLEKFVRFVWRSSRKASA